MIDPLGSTRFRIPVALFVLLRIQLAVSAAPVVSTAPVSALRPEASGSTGAGESSSPLLSGDGRVVVFSSGADNLVANDRNGALDVFVYDAQTQQLSLVSTNLAGTGSANARSVALDLSTNGQWLLFQTQATDLIPADTNRGDKLILKNLATGSATLISVNTQGAPSGNSAFNNSSLSPDGRFFVFDSPGTDLHPADTNGVSDVFVRDMVTGSNDLVSVRWDGLASGSGNSENPVMSGDGRWVAFQSIATNLAPNDTTTTMDVYIRDRQSNTTTLVSINRFGTGPGNGASSNPSISEDGRYVAFESAAILLTTNSASGIFLRDINAETTRYVSSQKDNGGGADRPVISPDGRFIAYESRTNLYCAEIASGAVFLLTTNHLGAGGGSGASFNPQFTPNGRHCVFMSFATNLTAQAMMAGPPRIFLRDMETGTISLISTNLNGMGSDLESLAPAISADGETIAFQSYDENLVEDDLNQASDVFLHRTTNGFTRLLSRRSTVLPAVTAVGRSGIGRSPVSADGRFVLFASTANLLTGEAIKSQENLFVRDLWIGSNQLVSASLTGGGSGNGFNFTPSLSGGGQWAVFQSTSSNLVAGDSNNVADIFVRDLEEGTNVLVSQAWTGGNANGFSVNPGVSSNGRFVVFQSAASNLTPLDTNSDMDVFVRDLVFQTNLAVSVHPLTGQCVGAQPSTVAVKETPYAPLISPDGSWVILWSAVNLTTNVASVGSPGLFAKHLPTGQVLALGIPTNGVVLAGNNTAAFSPGGRFVAFTTTNNLVGIFDLSAETNIYLLSDGKNPALSADGRWLAFEGRATNWAFASGNDVADVLVLDRQSGSVRLVSSNRLATASGNGASTTPLVSADGRFVIFQSKASDLVAADTNEQWDVFVHDLQTGSTFALFAPTGGSTGNRLSRNPVLGADGRTVVFESFASDVVSGDFNQARDVFVARLSAGDADSDGMDDDWEVANFGNLTRDGSGDADADGASDKAEFIAGTSPIDQLSVLRVITLTALADGSTTLLWSSVPGKTYRVEFKDDLASSTWSQLAGDVFAIGPTSSKSDPLPDPSGRRFYRVMVVN